MDPSKPDSNKLSLYRVTYSWGVVEMLARDLPHAIASFEKLCPKEKPLSICLSSQWPSEENNRHGSQPLSSR